MKVGLLYAFGIILLHISIIYFYYVRKLRKWQPLSSKKDAYFHPSHCEKEKLDQMFYVHGVFQKLHLKYFYYRSSFIAFGSEVLGPYQEYL